MSDELLKKLLNYDALDNAERITGKSYKEDPLTETIGFIDHVRSCAEKRETLELLDDTTFSNTLERYTRILREEGFEQVLCLPFTGRDEKPETFQVWFHPDGLLLKFDTYGSGSINGGNFYFQIRLNSNSARIGMRCSSQMSRVDESAMIGDFDCREALRFHIRQLRSAGTLLAQWVEKPWLWLLHYMDTEDPNYNHKAITAERVALLPEHVRKAICA
jgi:hypothetical protein